MHDEQQMRAVIHLEEVLDHTEYLALNLGERVGREAALFGVKSDRDESEFHSYKRAQDST